MRPRKNKTNTKIDKQQILNENVKIFLVVALLIFLVIPANVALAESKIPTASEMAAAETKGFASETKPSFDVLAEAQGLFNFLSFKAQSATKDAKTKTLSLFADIKNGADDAFGAFRSLPRTISSMGETVWGEHVLPIGRTLENGSARLVRGMGTKARSAGDRIVFYAGKSGGGLSSAVKEAKNGIIGVGSRIGQSAQNFADDFVYSTKNLGAVTKDIARSSTRPVRNLVMNGASATKDAVSNGARAVFSAFSGMGEKAVSTGRAAGFAVKTSADGAVAGVADFGLGLGRGAETIAYGAGQITGNLGSVLSVFGDNLLFISRAASQNISGSALAVTRGTKIIGSGLVRSPGAALRLAQNINNELEALRGSISIPSPSSIFARLQSASAELEFAGKGIENKLESVKQNFPDAMRGLLAQASDSLSSVWSAVAISAENIAWSASQAPEIFSQAGKQAVSAVQKMAFRTAQSMVEVGAAASRVPQAAYDGSKKLFVSAKNILSDKLSFVGKRSRAIEPRSETSVSTAGVDFEHGDGAASLAFNSVLDSVKTTAKDSVASLGEVFVNAPQSILKDTWTMILSWGKGLKNFANNTKLAILGKKVTVGEKPPSSVLPPSEKVGTKAESPVVPPAASSKSVIARSEATKQSQLQATSYKLPAVLGSTTIDGALTVNGNTTLKGKEVKIAGPLLLENNFTVASVFSIDAVTGNVVSAGDITASGKLSSKDLTAKGTIDFSGATIDFTGAKVTGLATSGGTIVNNYFNNPARVVSSGGGGGVGGQFFNLSIAQDAGIGGALTVTGDGIFNSNVTIGNAAADILTINASTVSIPNGITFSNGAVTFGSGATATSTFGGNIAVNGAGTSTFAYGATVATTGGALGVGTSSPVAKLGVVGNAYISGNTTIGNSTTFFVDATNNRVALSTSSPLSKLHIAGSSDERQLIVQANSTQNANVFEYINSAGSAPLLWISPAGNFGTSGTLAVAGTLNASSTFSVAGAVTSSNLYPWTNNNYDIGAYGAAWRNAYVSGTLYADGISTSTFDGLTIGGSTAATSTFTGLTLNETGSFNSILNLGDGGDDIVINSNDWDISSAGVTSNLSITTSTLDNVVIGGSTNALGRFTTLVASTTLAVGTSGTTDATSTIYHGLELGNRTGYNRGVFNINTLGNASASGTLQTFGLFTPLGGISTSTWDNIIIGRSTANEGRFTAVTSTVGFFGSGAATTGTLTVAGSSAWLTVGNGTASTTITGHNTSTFPYGATFATTGGNVGIGTSSPVASFSVNGNTYITSKLGVGVSPTTKDIEVIGAGYPLALQGSSGKGLTFTNNNNYIDIVGINNAGSAYNDISFRTGNNSIFYINTAGNIGIGTTAPNAKLEVAGGTTSTMLSVYDNIYFGRTSTSTLTVGNRGSATSTFYSDLSIVNRDVLIGGAANSGWLWTGDGTATTSIRGGTAGSATSTFEGDVSIANLFLGSMEFDVDAGLVSAIDLPVSASASAGTKEGYSFLIDGIPAMTVVGESNGSGEARNGFVGIGTMYPSHLLTMVSSSPTLAIGTGSATSTLTQNTLSVNTASGYNLGYFYVDSSGNVNASGTIASRGFSTSTLDNVIIGRSTASEGRFSAVTSTVGFFGTGAATTGTLTVAGSSAWLTVGNGTASTTIGGYSTTATTTNPYGAVFANLGGNVGIGDVTPSYKLDVAGHISTNGGQVVMTGVTANSLNVDGLTMWGGSAGGGLYARGDVSGGNDNFDISGYDNVLFSTVVSGSFERMRIVGSNGRVGIGSTNPSGLLDVAGDIKFGGTATTTLTTGNRGSATSTFYSDLSIVNRDVLIGGNTNTGWLYITDGTATTSIRGGTAGSVTSTFQGDVSISNLYSGLITMPEDGGIVDIMDLPVSASAANGTLEGYNFLIDGIPALSVVGVSNGSGETRNNFVGIGTMYPSHLLTMVSSSPTLAIGTGSVTSTLTHNALSVGTVSSTNISAWDNIYIGRTATTTLTTGNRGSATSSFYSDLSIVNRDVLIGGAANTGWLWVGDGTATTSIRGGTAGSVTSTFQGDVVISNFYTGMAEFDVDAGIVGAFTLPVSASATTGTEEGYTFAVDNLDVARIVSTADALGSVWDPRLELTNWLGTATTTIRGTTGTTSTFAGNVQVNGEFAVSGNCTENGGACVDIAESYTSIDNVEAGDVVVSSASSPFGEGGQEGDFSPYNSSLVQKSFSAYAANVVGIVSTRPGIILGESGVRLGGGGSGDSNNPNIALAGRVPVKVTNENGVIKKGDLLVTSASVPGHAMKFVATSTPAGMVNIFAMALEDWNLETEAASIAPVNYKTNKLIALIKSATVFIPPSFQGGGEVGDSTPPSNDADTSSDTANATVIQSAFNGLLTVRERGADISVPEQYFDFAGKSLTNIKSIASANDSWSLDENGAFISKSVNAKAITLNDLIIIGSKEALPDGVELDPAIGNTFIPNGETVKVVYNNRVKKNSQIFITFRDNAGGPWWISNQGDGFFEVSVATLMGYNIRFSYWIVGVSGGDSDPMNPAGYSSPFGEGGQEEDLTSESSPLSQGGGEVGDISSTSAPEAEPPVVSSSPEVQLPAVPSSSSTPPSNATDTPVPHSSQSDVGSRDTATVSPSSSSSPEVGSPIVPSSSSSSTPPSNATDTSRATAPEAEPPVVSSSPEVQLPAVSLVPEVGTSVVTPASSDTTTSTTSEPAPLPAT